MPIANYTTTVKQLKTIGEIQSMLVEHGVSSISIDYAEKQPAALYFIAEINFQSVPFRLPSKWEGVLQAMKRDSNVPKRYCVEDQARRVAWRITRDWVRAQLAIIEAGQVSLGEVFLPYAVNSDGQTVYELFSQKGFAALAPAK
ncbi:MAG: hypothetical protein AAFY20_27085 [Cyanobacteria bacterium J06639_14]